MLKIRKNSVYLTRGDSAYITMALSDNDGNPVEITNANMIQIQVRTEPNYGALLFSGEILDNGDGSYTWYIKPTDTKDLEVGTYYYDAQLVYENGDIFTFIKSSRFIVTDEVTFEEVHN